MKLGDIYEEGGLGFFLLYGFIFLIITVGCIGQAVWCYIWWGRIRYDFSCRKNNNEIAYDLYVSVFCGWIFGFLFWALTIISAVIHFLTKKCCNKTGRSNEFLKHSSFLAAIGFFVTCILVLVWSTDKNCEQLYDKGLEKGQNTTEYNNWYNELISGMSEEELKEFQNNFNDWRCHDGYTNTWIFFGFFIAGIILLIVSIPCVKVSFELDVMQLLLDDQK